MIQWQYFPKSVSMPRHLSDVVDVFKTHEKSISSERKGAQNSNAVLARLASDLESLGYRVETGKRRHEKITVPVLFGRNGQPEKSFDADAYSDRLSTVVEVEAGRAVVNNQFLKDLFQASMMERVEYCVIAVRNVYKASKDFDLVCRFMDTLYASHRLRLPLKGILIIGY